MVDIESSYRPFGIASSALISSKSHSSVRHGVVNSAMFFSAYSNIFGEISASVTSQPRLANTLPYLPTPQPRSSTLHPGYSMPSLSKNAMSLSL